MAVQYNKYGVNAVVPKLPSLNIPNTYTPSPNYPKNFNNNTFNPEDYYTTALGFLPIDTRYLSNTTNSLAYNSMADVLLNRGAQIKRYGYDSWLNTWYGYIPRVVADTALLLKEQTVDPILAGAVEDGWSGLMRGTATAGMNTLINLGNTLDVFSNPIKGLILEGSEGFQKGLIGDSRGRKQYDYNEYINTGNGWADFGLSMIAEMLTDPLNLISLGGKGLVSLGSKEVANAATDTMRTALKTALDNGLESVDALTNALTTSVKYLSKDTAEGLVKQMFDSTGNISKASVDATLDNVSIGLRKALNRIGYSSSKADDVMKLAESFSQGKASRFKAGLVDRAAALTPDTQRTVSDYLLHSLTDMPDLLASNASSRYALGSTLIKGVNNTERALRYTAGATGLDLFVGADRLGKYINAKLNNTKAKKHLKNVAHTFRILRAVDDFKLTDDTTFVDAVGAVNAAQHTEVFNSFLNRKERYIRTLLNRKDLNRVTDKTFIKAQAELDKAVKSILKKLKDPNIKTLDDYINYFEMLGATTDVSKYIESLNDLKHILNADMTDKAVRLEFTDAVTAYKAMATKELTNAQSDSMALGDDLVAAHREAWLKKKNLAKILNTEQAQLDDAIEFITNTDNLKQLDEVIIPYTRVALADTPYGDERGLLEFKENVFKEDGTPYTRTFTDKVPIGLGEHYNAFKAALEDYDKATDDLKARAHLVHSYETLVDYLKQLAKFDDNVNINNATQITNKLGAHPIGIYTTSQKALQAPSGTFQRNKRYLTSDTHKLYNSTDALDERRLLDSEVHVINGKKFSDSAILALSDSLLEKFSKDEYFKDDYFKAFLSLDNSVITARELQEYLRKWYFSLLTEPPTNEVHRYIFESLQDHIETTYSTLELRAFELAPKIRATTYYIDEFDVPNVTPILTAEELTKLINDLPTFNIKTQTFLVNLNEHIENELLTYTVQQSSTNFVNQLLGLDETGKSLESTAVLTEIQDTCIKAFDKALQSEGVVTGDDLIKALLNNSNFVNLNHNTIVTFIETMLDDSGVVTKKRMLTELNKLSKTDTLKQHTVYLKFKKDVTNHRQYGLAIQYLLSMRLPFSKPLGFKGGITPEDVQTLLESVRYTASDIAQQLLKSNEDIPFIQTAIKLHPNSKLTADMSDEVEHLIKVSKKLELCEQLTALSQASDNKLRTLFDINTFTDVPKIKKTQTGLADLITEYEDIHSDLYQALNTPDLYSDVVYADVVIPMRALIERLQGYRTLITQVSNAFEYNQLGDVFKAGIVDATVSQLKRGRIWTDYTIDGIVEEMLSGLDIFVKTRLGADSVAMDALLRNAVEAVENNPNLSQAVKDTATAIRESLTSGKAHEAMTDVDNWVRLMSIAEHTDNPLLKGVRQKMLSIANGKYIVVFDIETTGTVEAAAKPYQLSGKVLAPDGTVVPGSEFNYIIKLSENERPVNTVLKKSAPAGTTDLKKWWKDNVTNAVDDVATHTRAFNTVDEAIQAFQSECIKYGTDNFILAGQNIRKFDTVMLKKYATDTAVDFFNKVKMFDSIEHFNIKNVFQLQGMHRNVIKERLMTIFSKAMSEDNAVFKHKLFTFNDIETLRSFKEEYSKIHTTITSSRAALDRDFALLNETYGEDLSAADIDDLDVTDISTKQGTLRPGHYIETQDVFNIEDSIDSIVQAWRSPSKFKGKTYFIATKLDPNAYEKEVQKHLTHLAKQGLLDVAPGQTIMNYFTTGVASGKILLNPRRVTSYEIVDVFDKDKILNHFKVEDKADYINVYDMERFSRITKSIKSKRIGLTEDVVNLLVPDARKFLKELSEGKFHKVQESVQYGLEKEGRTVLSKRLTDYHLDYALAVSDDLDDVTAVATALYFYQRLGTPIEEYQLLGNLSEAYRMVREINSDYTPTPLLHKVDKVTGQPRIIYESNAFSYKEIADAAKSYNPLYAINKYTTDRNLYNIADIAIHNLHANDSILLNDVMKYLNSKPKVQSEVESRFKSYRHQLNNAAVHEILFRPDRVDALASEARVRMGRTYFTTKSQIDLTDFKEDGRFLVRENILLEDKTYGHVILMRNELLKQADKTLEFKPRMVKAVADLSDDEFNLLKRCRERMSKRVHNLGLSHGDILTKERLVDFDRALLDNGWFTKEELDQVIGINTLDADSCFNQLNANNSILGGYVAHKALFGEETVYISDPFKQLCYNTTGYIANHNNRLVSYLNLFMNENTSINNKVWSELKLKDQVDLFKSNSDFGVYYIRASETKWEKTGSGFIVEELKIINEKSIELAQKLNAIVLPRQQAAQMIKAINDFELPKIAQIARDISSLYKVAYLGSIGFLIRNLIDSNYKTRWALDGEVSLPAQIKHLFSTMKLLKQYTEIGQTYTAVMHKYFDTDLDYSTFYKVCNNIDLDEEELLKIVTEGLDERNTKRAIRAVHDLLEVVDKSELKQLQPKLIEPDLFSIIDSFDRYGPSGGMVKSIRDNIINPNTNAVESSAVRQLVDLITEKSPARFVYTFNEFIEKSARLSMFLQDLDRGSSVNDAIKNVINAHFDYSDKSLRMVYTEIVFPFLSFSYKNMEFWINTISKNPMLLGELENVFRPIFDFQSLYNPDQEAYEAYDYTFDWSKDVWSFEANAPWTMINAARLYHILNGNVVVDMNKQIQHDAGYGVKDTDLYAVFKLSPSFLDAVKMLYSPLSSYSERLLPPLETLLNIVGDMSEDGIPDKISVASLANSLPYIDVIMQRVGIDANGLKHNNLIQRVEDGGLPMALSSVFGLAYVPYKNKMYYYDSDYNVLNGFKPRYYAKRYYPRYSYNGGFNQNYYGRRSYSNPYTSQNPRYTLTRMAQNKKPKSIYHRSKTNNAYTQQYNSLVKQASDKILRYRIRDYNSYY